MRIRSKKFYPIIKLSQREAIAFYFLILPWLIGFILFTIYPIGATIYYSLTEYNGVQAKFTGISNYIELVSDDKFYKSLSVTLKYASISVPLNTFLALSVAIVLNQKVPFLSFWRTIFYLPSVLSGVAVALLWKWILDPQFGIVNYILLRLLGIQGPRWFYSEHWVIPSYWIMGIWGIGGAIVIYLAALQSIPTILYEAAEIDGANAWGRFRYITFPSISPVILFTLITNLIFALRTFTQVSVISEGGRGGPNNASLFYVLYLFQNEFHWSRMGYASALALVLCLVTLILTLCMFRVSNRLVYYEYTK